MRRLFLIVLAVAAAVLIGSAGLMPLWAEGDEALEAGIDAYVYAYPLVLMDVTRLYVERATGAKNNTFFLGRVLADPGSKDPDDNLLASGAWLDLSREPVILHIPDFGSRYRRVQVIDGWTHMLTVLRTDSEARDFALVGPHSTGELPSGVTVINSPTDMVLIQVHSRSSGEIEDIAAICSLLELMSLKELSSDGGPIDVPPVIACPSGMAMKSPSEQIAEMNAKTFFTYFADLLSSNPPSAADAAMMAKIASLGIIPGPQFDFESLDPGVKDVLSRSVRPAQTRLRQPSLPRAITDARLDPSPGAYYLSRAHSAMVDLATNIPVPGNGDAPSPAGGSPSEETIALGSGILFKAEGHRRNETGFDIRDDIARGQEFLKDKAAGYSQVLEEKRIAFFDDKGRRKERLVVKRVKRPNFLLAVEDLKERTIRQVLITSRGCVTRGFRVTRALDNGVASRFEVTYPENMAILALRTTVRSATDDLKEVVYTPYSPEIDTREIRKAGLDYLMERIKLARNDLAAKKVRLDGFAETGDTTPIEVSLVLSIIEHIDPGRFERRKDSEVALVHEVLTIIGANTTRAYSYSKSRAGAMGLFQLVPDTYRRLQEKYRSAGLTRDFAVGCSDHTNAAKASLLLFNSDLANLPRKWLRPGGKDGRSVGMYLAAAYNCGSKRVGKSTRECKGQWTCRLPEETRVYLEKFAAVWNLRKVLDQ